MINADQLRKFLDENKGRGRIDEALLNCPYFTEDAVLKLFAEALGWEYLAEIPANAVPVEFIESVPATYAQHHFLIGIRSQQGNGDLTIVLSKPLDANALDNVSKMTGLPVQAAISTRTAITAVIDVAYEQRSTVIEEVAEELDQQNLDQLVDEVAGSDDLLDVVNRPPVIRLVNDMLFRALQMRASDIHVHPYETKIQIRYRIDGILYDVLSLNRNVLPLVISRIKVMAGMDIAERRLPQDGQFKLKSKGKEVEFRVSTLPVVGGEKAVLRVLDKSLGLLNIDKCGIRDEYLEPLKKVAASPYGMIIMCGPTGSGKTSTLYSLLNYIHTPEKNTVTVEDPVEYQIKGLNQVSVNSKTGLTFTKCLRSILRQDPDIIMIGEIRDFETMDIAIKAALTGHLVLSTLHTTTAPGSVVRMIDMGVQPFLINASVLCVIAQRLARRICLNCRQPVSGQPYFIGGGCKDCFQTGYSGRAVITEILYMNQEIRDAVVAEELDENKIKSIARSHGMKTLREEGEFLARQGITTMEEVYRLTPSD